MPVRFSVSDDPPRSRVSVAVCSSVRPVMATVVALVALGKRFSSVPVSVPPFHSTFMPSSKVTRPVTAPPDRMIALPDCDTSIAARVSALAVTVPLLVTLVTPPTARMPLVTVPALVIRFPVVGAAPADWLRSMKMPPSTVPPLPTAISARRLSGVDGPPENVRA